MNYTWSLKVHRNLRPGLASAFLLCVFPLMGALCGNTAAKTDREIVQEQACIKNVEAGDYDRAETRCEVCLEYNERNPECLNGLGLIWYGRGVDDKARDYFKKCKKAILH